MLYCAIVGWYLRLEASDSPLQAWLKEIMNMISYLLEVCFIPTCLSDTSSPCYSQALTYTFQGEPPVVWLLVVSPQQTLRSES